MASTPREASLTAPHRSDFAFLYGRWRVHHRKLKTRLAGSDEWITFESTSACIPVLDGLGNIDEFRTSAGPMGTSLRFYDLVARRWSIWWVANADGRMQPPVTGGFDGRVGTFEGRDTHEGNAIVVRYVWNADSVAPRWEQAFSPDDGHTWESNWVMDFTRDSSPSPWPPDL